MSTAAQHYTAIIRTDRCDDLVQQMVARLYAQSLPPSEVLFVDSSGSNQCSEDLRNLGGRVVLYPREPFNFSKAINIGVEAAQYENCLIISSHVLLDRQSLVADGLNAAQESSCGVVYWAPVPANQITECRKISAANFNGTNGLSNSCAFIPTALLRERPFREEVFSAEDQEWAAWYLRTRKGNTLRFVQPGMRYLNPNTNITKKINEEISIAYFTYRRNLHPDKILSRLARVIIAAARRRPEHARMHWEICKGLLLANFRKPTRQSKYF
jgi:glycosyltransferase involved in cell wall biosynthesis